MSMITGSLDAIQDQLDELESMGEMPPLALQITGQMLHQHAQLMSHHADELDILLDSDLGDAQPPWGSSDSNSYDMQEYGAEAIEESMESDPIHEVKQIRNQMSEMTEELRKSKKRLMTFENVYGINKVRKHCTAFEVLNFEDEKGNKYIYDPKTPRARVSARSGKNLLFRPKCRICYLEEPLMEKYGLPGGGTARSNSDHFVFCKDLNIYVHNSLRATKRHIFNMDRFANMTCFDIAHSDYCQGLFYESKKRVNVQQQHPLFQELVEIYKTNYSNVEREA